MWSISSHPLHLLGKNSVGTDRLSELSMACYNHVIYLLLKELVLSEYPIIKIKCC